MRGALYTGVRIPYDAKSTMVTGEESRACGTTSRPSTARAIKRSRVCSGRSRSSVPEAGTLTGGFDGTDAVPRTRLDARQSGKELSRHCGHRGVSRQREGSAIR